MFEQLVESTSKKQGRRWTYFAGTSAAWLLVTSAVIVAGVAGYDARLNKQFETLTFILPTPPLAKPPAGPKIDKKPTVAEQRPAAFVSQQQTPQAIPQASSQPPVVFAAVGGSGSGPGVPGGDPNGVPGGVIDGVPGTPAGLAIADPPPPPPTPKREEPPVKPSPRISTVLQGSAIRRVEPLYPRMASNIGVTGAVVVEVVVDEKGNVISARALSGHPLLRPAAENAARGWRWNPTLLNGVPVQVVGTITFNFVK